jgi:acetyl-CoA acetyltransferase
MGQSGYRASEVRLEVFEEAFPEKKVETILRELGRESVRVRQLPATMMVYYIIALGLFVSVGCREVLRRLLESRSKINDGAAALVVASADWAEKNGREPFARIIAQATAAQEPEWFTTAPAKAIEIALKRAGMTVGDIDLFEINEAFAVVAMAAMKDANIPHEKMNVYGGAVALGHPIGSSGARILVTLLHALETQNLKRGMAAICIGGGEAAAMIVERM